MRDKIRADKLNYGLVEDVDEAFSSSSSSFHSLNMSDGIDVGSLNSEEAVEMEK